MSCGGVDDARWQAVGWRDSHGRIHWNRDWRSYVWIVREARRTHDELNTKAATALGMSFTVGRSYQVREMSCHYATCSSRSQPVGSQSPSISPRVRTPYPPRAPPPIPQTRTPSGVPTETFFLPLSNLVDDLPSPSVEEGRRCGGANATHTQASPCIGCHGVECVQLEE